MFEYQSVLSQMIGFRGTATYLLLHFLLFLSIISLISIYHNLFLIALSESVYGLMPGSGYQEQICLNGRWLEGYFIPQPSWLD